MSKRLTTEQFIKQAKQKHGNTYDYSNVEYVEAHGKIEIICKEHGSFWQAANSHKQGKGCPICGKNKGVINRRFSRAQFLEKAKLVYGDLYDYSKSEYTITNNKIEIICKKHGSFWQTPFDHFRSTKGCPKCGFIRYSNFEIIEKFKLKHNGKYDYSKVKYVNTKSKVSIICKEHGIFNISPDKHLQGRGCPLCNDFKLNTNLFIKKAQKVHANRYDYSKVEYLNSTLKVEILCKEHGSFWQTANKHINSKNGCPYCADIQNGENQRLNLKSVIKSFKDIHGDVFNYSKVAYSTNADKVEIICKDHGSFWQSPMKHFVGNGCPSCAHRISQPEIEIGDFLESLGFDVRRNVRGLFADPNFEADIFLPEKNIVIEYDGLIWHSEKFAKNLYNVLYKTRMANEKGYRCIHIREDYYLADPEKVRSLLKSAVGLFDNKIGARKTIKKDISLDDYKRLCLDHLQGYRPAKVKKGLFYNGDLVAVIGYNTSGELIRYVVKNGWLVQGALPKLLKNEEVTFSFCDLSFFTGSSYPKAGFTLDSITKPNYIYVKGLKVRSRQQMMKHKLPNILNIFDDNLTEVENCNINNWYRLFDVGNAKYVIK